LRQLKATGLLREITPELAAAPQAFWDSVARSIGIAPASRSAPELLTNALLAGTLLHPLGLISRRRFHADALERRVELGMLPIARRDIERLQQILALQPRLLDIEAPSRAQRGLLHRAVLPEALTWLEIHGERPTSCEHWEELLAEPRDAAPPAARGAAEEHAPYPRRRPPAPPPPLSAATLIARSAGCHRHAAFVPLRGGWPLRGRANGGTEKRSCRADTLRRARAPAIRPARRGARRRADKRRVSRQNQ
jgi:hypothetical protein